MIPIIQQTEQSGQGELAFGKDSFCGAAANSIPMADGGFFLTKSPLKKRKQTLPQYDEKHGAKAGFLLFGIPHSKSLMPPTECVPISEEKESKKAVNATIGSATLGSPILHHSLSGVWQFRQADRTELYPSLVPGCIHDDLISNGLIPDPYFGENEKGLQWIGESDWIYTRTFNLIPELREKQNVILRCEGLDTFARVYLNGLEVASTDNMFRTWEWNIKKFLTDGENQIKLQFSSVMPYIREKEASRKMFSWNAAGGCAYAGTAYVRKMACNFGWDWGPKMVSAGIWKDISIVAWDHGRIDDVHIRQYHREDSVAVEVEVSAPGAASVRTTIFLDEKFGTQAPIDCVCPVPKGESGSKIKTVLPIPNPRLWWPNGLGPQPLYHVLVETLAADASVMDQKKQRIGLRTIELQRNPDQWGESFQFAVNGVSFFAKGANWIPIDPFPSQKKPERTFQLLNSAVAVHMNMIRVWGGGVYADECFLDACDERGLLVWHDFMFACSTYPAFDETFLANVEAEARDAVARIRHHACLALWCGNNELEQGIAAETWSERTMSWEDYKKIFDEILPRVVAELDPSTPYWPCSPHSPKERQNFNSEREGDAHLWDVWFTDAPFESYRQSGHRFNSEFGFQSFPELKTVKYFAESDEWNISGPVFEHHQRSGPGNARIFQKIMDWFRVPKNFESTLILSQISQALAIGVGVEHWRRSMPRTMGTLYWQLNDNWPAASWSSIDSFGRWKALHYAARHFFAPVMVSGLARDSAVEVHVTSDLLTELTATLVWTVTDLQGILLEQGSQPLSCPSRCSRKIIALHPAGGAQNSRHQIVWIQLESEGRLLSETTVLFDRPRRMNWTNPRIQAALTEASDEIQVTLTANSVAFWVWLELAEIDVIFSDNFFHLRPGAPKVITFSRPAHISPAQLEAMLTVRSLFDTY